jgi:hypothetical protein
VRTSLTELSRFAAALCLSVSAVSHPLLTFSLFPQFFYVQLFLYFYLLCFSTVCLMSSHATLSFSQSVFIFNTRPYYLSSLSVKSDFLFGHLLMSIFVTFYCIRWSHFYLHILVFQLSSSFFVSYGTCLQYQQNLSYLHRYPPFRVNNCVTHQLAGWSVDTMMKQNLKLRHVRIYFKLHSWKIISNRSFSFEERRSYSVHIRSNKAQVFSFPHFWLWFVNFHLCATEHLNSAISCLWIRTGRDIVTCS